MTYDIRAIANVVLDRADELGVGVSNVHINKILFFIYAWYLLMNNKPISKAKIEAWNYGPVFREIYSAFRQHGSDKISSRAKKLNLEIGSYVECREEFDSKDEEFIRSIMDHLIYSKPFDLVNLTHAEGSPWYRVYNHSGRSNPGMRISDALILEHLNEVRQ